MLYATVTAFAAVLAFPFYWMLLGALVVVITLALALPAGYALARLTGKWKDGFHHLELGVGVVARLYARTNALAGLSE